jgi:hypothetical protein
MSYRNRNAARLLRWQSLAKPAQVLRGALTDGAPGSEAVVRQNWVATRLTLIN